MIFILLYLLITNIYCLPCVSLISASTLKDWHSCSKQFIFMLDRTIVKPKEVIVVISNSESDKNKTYRRNENITISLFFRKGKHNQADNRNFGINYANCPIITIFDIDDFLSKYAIQEVIKIFTTIPDVDMTLHTYVRQRAMLDTEDFDINNITQYIFPYNYSYIYSNYYEHRDDNRYIHCCYFIDKSLPIHNAWLSIKREILQQNKYNESWEWYRREDSELGRRLILKKYNMLLMSYPFGHYMQYGECYV